MKKLFFALAVVALLAGCKTPPEPQLEGFTFGVEELAEQVRITVTPGTPDVYYYWSYDRAVRVEEPLKDYIAAQLKGKQYESAKNTGLIVKGQDSYIPSSLDLNTEYLVYACYVRAAEDGTIQVIGKPDSYKFWTSPKEPTFSIYNSALYDRVQLKIIPEDTEADYFYWIARQSDVDAAGSVTEYVEQKLEKQTYAKWKNGGFILHGIEENIIDPSVDDIMAPDTRYIVYACYVTENTQGYARLNGHVSAREFRTTPAFMLNGEFSVSATDRANFAYANLQTEGDAYIYGEYPWSYLCEHGLLEAKRDLFQFTEVQSLTNGTVQMLGCDEWRYLLRTRERADELFAHATVAGVHGLILLPDGWTTPDGISLTTSKQMGIVWNETQIEYLADESLNGYAQNSFTASQWTTLEFAGAVFLPAAGWNSKEANETGKYYTSTPVVSDIYVGYAYNVKFTQYSVSLRGLTYYGNGDGNFYSVRPVWRH